MGGVPAQLVPDNPKVGVDRANWYEPGLNRTYLDLATHYRTAILPAAQGARQAGKTLCVSPALTTGRRLPTNFTAPPQQHGINRIPGKVKLSAGYQP